MNILIVEDEPKARAGLAALVGRLRPSALVQTAVNGAAALELCRETDFDLIFTDIKMPGMSGLEMLDKLDSSCRQIVIVSGYADFSYAQHAIQRGVADYLLKPVSPAKIRQALERAEQNLRGVKRSCLVRYLQEYPFLEEEHRRWLRQRLGLEGDVFVLWGRGPASGENREAWEKEGSALGEEVYAFSYGENALLLLWGADVNEEAVKAWGKARGLGVQRVTPEQLPQVYQKQMQTEELPPREDSESGRAVRLVKQFVRENYVSEISLKSLSEITYLHPNYLSKIFKQETGENISDYILRFRIEKAKELLRDPSLKIYEVAEKAGFHASKYFASVFKAEVGVTPSEFREGL